MAQPEYHGLLDSFYQRIGAGHIIRSGGPRLFTPDRDPGHLAGMGNLYVDGALVDRYGAVRHFNEKVMQHKWMSKYFTVTVDLPAQPHHGQRGEFWESMAHWHVCAYANARGDGLAAVVVCNFQAFQDFVMSRAKMDVYKDKWVESTSTKRFLRVPITTLLHDRKAANVVVTCLFDDQAQSVYNTKRASLRLAYKDNPKLGHWSDIPVYTYKAEVPVRETSS